VVSIWEHRKLKSEKEELKRILGIVMLELEIKKSWRLIAGICNINSKNVY